jgi:hypothetical protein
MLLPLYTDWKAQPCNQLKSPESCQTLTETDVEMLICY